MLYLRTAGEEDIPALQTLIPLSVRALSHGYYTPIQIESSIRYVFGVDHQLIIDRTYFLVETADGAGPVGCGGWSYRQTLYGRDQMKAQADPVLDPERDAARIRAFFVHPASARRGVGNMLMHACLEAIARTNFRSVELAATLPGEPLYRKWGFAAVERFEQTLPDGVCIPFVRMRYEPSCLEQPPEGKR